MSIPVIYSTAAEEKIKIIDAEGQVFVFPKTFELRSDPISKRSTTLPAAYVHGGLDVSDGMYSSRVIEITGKIVASTDFEYNTKWDALAEHLNKEDFWVVNRGRMIKIKKIVGISHDSPSLCADPYGEISISMLASDPFWYAENAASKVITISASPHSFTWSIGGKIEVTPIIIIYNLVSNTDFTLRNETDLNREFRVANAGATPGTTITIDCREGTVTRDGTDIISSFSKLFLRFLGGRDNAFRYTGAICTITAQYRNCWI
jgi:phage-related protein